MADTNAKTSPRRLRAAERRARAYNMRIAGASYRRIGEALGISHEAARQLVAKDLKKTQDVTDELREELRKIELERLDAMQTALWPAAMQGDQGAIDRILKIMQRRAQITGLDQHNAIKLDVAHPSLEDLISRILPPRYELEADKDQAA